MFFYNKDMKKNANNDYFFINSKKVRKRIAAETNNS